MTADLFSVRNSRAFALACLAWCAYMDGTPAQFGTLVQGRVDAERASGASVNNLRVAAIAERVAASHQQVA